MGAMHHQQQITVSTHGQALYEITGALTEFVAGHYCDVGVLTCYCRHTSASLLIQENADRKVVDDLNGFFARLVPEGMDWLTHTAEGADDMPAHIKAALTQTVLSIPVQAGALLLGTWQGVFLFEHRHAPHERQIVLHISGDAEQVQTA